MHQNQPFGLAPYINEQVQSIGTRMKIKSIEREYEDGRMDIKTEALGLYKMDTYVHPMEDKLYAGAETTNYSYDKDSDLNLASEIRDKMKAIYDILQIDQRLPAPELLLTYHIAHNIGWNLQEEYHLLCMKKEFDRQIQVLRQISLITPKIKTAEQVKSKALMNGEYRSYRSPTDF